MTSESKNWWVNEKIDKYRKIPVDLTQLPKLKKKKTKKSVTIETIYKCTICQLGLIGHIYNCGNECMIHIFKCIFEYLLK